MITSVRNIGIRIHDNLTVDGRRDTYQSSLPDGGVEGQILKINNKGQPEWVDLTDVGYIHPETHPAEMIVESEDRMFVNSREKDVIASVKEEDTSVITYEEINKLF